ncbi:MAG: C45 family autoproteolytic acyltransferase/hydrolase [Candidatus Thorarchaeota archaeon]
MNTKFPILTLEGSHEEIGYQMGKKLKERIISALNFYKTLFNSEEKKIFEELKVFKEAIKQNYPQYVEEIENIARGADLDPQWIYALNSRSELMTNLNNLKVHECTAITLKEEGLSGQNWDWSKELEPLAVILRIKNTKTMNNILMMTEPGIIGKIGLNGYGLGVCLNFMHGGTKHLAGVPVHVILRAILDSSNIDEALKLVSKTYKGKEANILISDANGHSIDVEFYDQKQFITEITSDSYIHTNHYTKEKIIAPGQDESSSRARYQMATDILKHKKLTTINDIKDLLANRDNPTLPICRKYVPDPLIKNVGTVCTIIIDHRHLKMHITRGNPFDNKFDEIPLVI